MGYYTEAIDKVRASSFAMGIGSNGEPLAIPGLIALSWESTDSARLFQAYVNGIFAGVTSHPEQRRLLVQCDPAYPASIEIIAVDTIDRETDFSSRLTGFSYAGGSRVEITYPRHGELGLGSQLELFWDAGTGSIDYDSEALMQRSVWASIFEKWGWGLDTFGQGDFGYSGTGAPGWGLGALGKGEFGFDAEQIVLQTESLEQGCYNFGLKIVDQMSNAESEAVEIEVAVDPLPKAKQLRLDSYDATTNQLILEVF